MKKWLKRAAFMLVAVMLIVVIAAFAATRPFFIKTQVLPRVGKAIGIPIKVESIAFSPFSRLELRGLVLGPEAEPLATYRLVRCRYDFWKLIRRNLRIEEFLVEGGKVRIVQKPDGTILFPLVPAPVPPPTRKATRPAALPGQGAAPMRVHITDLAFRDIDVVFERLPQSDKPDTGCRVRIASVSLTVPELRNGTAAEVKFAGMLNDVRCAALTLDSGKVTAEIGVLLDDRLAPVQVSLQGTLNELRGQASALTLSGRAVDLSAQATVRDGVWQIGEIRVVESAAGRIEAGLTVTGRVTPDPLDAALDVTVTPLSSQALDLIGGLAGGYTFGRTEGQYTGHVTLKPGPVLTSRGQFALKDTTVAAPHLGIPALAPVDINVQHDVAVDMRTKAAVIHDVGIHMRQAGRDLVRVGISEPMTVSWANPQDLADAATPEVRLRVDRLPLAMLNPFLGEDRGTRVAEGELNVDITATVAELGRRIRATGSVQLDGLEARIGGTPCQGVTGTGQVALALSNYAEIGVESAMLEILVQDQSAGRIGIQGHITLQPVAGKVQIEVMYLNQDVLKALPAALLGDLDVQSLRLSGQVAGEMADGKTALDGKLNAGEVKALIPGLKPVAELQAEVSFSTVLAPGRIAVRRATVNARHAGRQFLDLNIDGNLALPVDTGPGTFTLVSGLVDLALVESMLQTTDGVGIPVPLPAMPAPAASPKPAAESPYIVPLPEQEPVPLDLAGLDLTVTLDLKNVLYHAIAARDWKGTARLQHNVITFAPLELVLDQAPTTLRGVLDLGKPGFGYALEAQVGELDLKPFVQTFAPGFEKNVEGSLKAAALSLSGEGCTRASLAEHLKGNLSLELGALALIDLPGLTRAATASGIQDLRRLTFDRGKLAAEIGAGRIRLTAAEFGGTMLQLDGTGSVGIDETLDLSFKVGVGSPMLQPFLKQAGVDIGLKDGEFVNLPMPLTILGTMAAPRVAVPKIGVETLLKFSGNVLGKALGAATDGKQTDLGTAVDLLRQLGGIKPAPAPAEEQRQPTPDAPKASADGADAPTTNDLLNLGLGILLKKDSGTQTVPADGTGTEATQPKAAETETAPPAEPAEPAKTADEERHERREERRDALKQLGRSLLQDLMKTNESKDQ